MENLKSKNFSESIFDNIKHIDEYGNEYWSARELQKVLEYAQWRRFESVINRAKEACTNSKNTKIDHFAKVGKMVQIGSNAKKEIIDYNLSRYACYLIVQNGDPKKDVIALGQTYFAIQTRRQELNEMEYKSLSEDEKRLYRRKQTKDGNKILYSTALKKGVKNFDKFTNYGYKGLYGGETAADIAKRKKLRYREDILDNMGSTELGANIFRITQTEELLKTQKEISEKISNDTHYKVGTAIRNTIKKLGGTMPEKLPTPNKSIKELEKVRTNNKIIKNK